MKYLLFIQKYYGGTIDEVKRNTRKHTGKSWRLRIAGKRRFPV